MNNSIFLDEEQLKKKYEEKERRIKKKISEKNKFERKEVRKARTKRLIKQGLLIDFSNLNKYSLATILGYLMEFEEKHKGNEYYLNLLELKGKTKFLEKKYDEN